MKQRRQIRILTAVPLCDGHDSAIMTVNLELVRRGVEVVYLGYHRSVTDIVRAAMQEDVQAVGISSYNGGHVEFFSEVVAKLRKAGARHIGVFGGGGGTITSADEKILKRCGVDRIFFAGTPLDEICDFVVKTYPPRASSNLKSLIRGVGPVVRHRSCPVIGISGAGGAGKSTLIDELVFRFLRANPRSRVAILCNDPSHVDTGGALLGDRAGMIYSQDDRVFMRQLASRGNPRGIARETPAAIEILRASRRFDLILVESIGIGQDGDPFGDLRGRRLVDATLLVMTPHYGGRLQLEKIALLNRAEVIALNKSDLPGSQTAQSELAMRIAANKRGQQLVATRATRHEDRGVDELFAVLCSVSRKSGTGDSR